MAEEAEAEAESEFLDDEIELGGDEEAENGERCVLGNK